MQPLGPRTREAALYEGRNALLLLFYSAPAVIYNIPPDEAPIRGCLRSMPPPALIKILLLLAAQLMGAAAGGFPTTAPASFSSTSSSTALAVSAGATAQGLLGSHAPSSICPACPRLKARSCASQLSQLQRWSLWQCPLWQCNRWRLWPCLRLLRCRAPRPWSRVRRRWTFSLRAAGTRRS
jgi:hypothetical protein